MSKKFTSNVVKYAVILLIAGHFGRELKMINYGSVVLAEAPELTASQTDIIKGVSFVLPLLLVYFGGIFADKYGRRLTWAVLLVLYGVSMLWLNTATSFGIASFGPAVVVTVLMSGSLALGRAPLAWLFDHEGKNGLKNAYGLYHVLTPLLVLVGIGLSMAGSLYHQLDVYSCRFEYSHRGCRIVGDDLPRKLRKSFIFLGTNSKIRS